MCCPVPDTINVLVYYPTGSATEGPFILEKDRMKEEAYGLLQLHTVLGPLGRVRNSFGMDISARLFMQYPKQNHAWILFLSE